MMNVRSVVTALTILVCSFQMSPAEAEVDCYAGYSDCIVSAANAANLWYDKVDAKVEACLGTCSTWVPAFQWVCEGFCAAKGEKFNDRIMTRLTKAFDICEEKQELCESKVCLNRGESFDPEAGACCPEQVFMPACAPCPDGWDGGLSKVYDNAGCHVGYECYCNEPANLGECVSDEQCLPGESCSANKDCFPCADCPMCDVCCGMCEPSQETCSDDECGPKPLMPTVMCEDGETWSGPTVCELQDGGVCGWTIEKCPTSSTCEYDGQEYAEGESFSGTGTNWCNDCNCGAGGVVNCTKKGCSSQCETNKDCDEGEWCRAVCDAEDFNECVPYAGLNDTCGGFVLPCGLELCEEGLSCINNNPFIADLPGTCQEPCEPVSCLVDPCEGAICTGHPDAECVADYCGGCNATFYLGGFPVECNAAETCTDGGEEYQVGDTFPGSGSNWCNQCECMEDGLVACTKMGCGPQPCETSDDCGAGTWCRADCEDPTFSSCVPFAGEGESCGGFVIPCYLEVCEEGLSCINNNPFIVDLPGTCQEPCEQVSCLVNPCDTASCPGYPDAQCIPNYCGGCNADFYNDGFLVTCEEPVSCSYGGETYAVGDLFDGTGSDWCNDCQCTETGDVACTKKFCGEPPCESDDDCAAGNWCRPICEDPNGLSECVPYVGQGESCGGFVLPCGLQLCEEGLSCQASNPLIPDLPGTCEVPCEEVQCFVNPCDNATCGAHPDALCIPDYCGGCNADFYVNGEIVDCEEELATCEVDGVTYTEGDSFNGIGDNWCNTCSCTSDGLVICTLIACAPNPCVVSGCSSQLCAPEPLPSTCEWLPEYACYQSVGSCGPFGKDGACMWDDTDALSQCLENAGEGLGVDK